MEKRGRTEGTKKERWLWLFPKQNWLIRYFFISQIWRSPKRLLLPSSPSPPSKCLLRSWSKGTFACFLLAADSLSIFLYLFVSCSSHCCSPTTCSPFPPSLSLRFRVPDSVPQQTKTLIQMRVCTVLKHWIEPHIDELGDVIDTITNFIETEMTSKELQVCCFVFFSVSFGSFLSFLVFFTCFLMNFFVAFCRSFCLLTYLPIVHLCSSFFLFLQCRVLCPDWKTVFLIVALAPLAPIITSLLPLTQSYVFFDLSMKVFWLCWIILHSVSTICFCFSLLLLHFGFYSPFCFFISSPRSFWDPLFPWTTLIRWNLLAS